ncbi:MAG: DUF5989 family protein [Polyangiaceae bacterium]|jgi:hypothetical protein
MLKKRGRIHRGILVMATAVPSIGGLVAGLWTSKRGRKWLAPVVLFLCVMGLLLILAATVEAVAPFIYTVF